MGKLKILVACERSGKVRDAFRSRGHDAWSCDIEPVYQCDEGNHFQGDAILALAGVELDRHFPNAFYEDKPGRRPVQFDWDAVISFAPCTYLCNSGAKHLYIDGRKENGKEPGRWRDMRAAAIFFRSLLYSGKPTMAENPVMHPHARKIIGRGPDQTFQPWHFGHKEVKRTCLWLEKLPPLKHTEIVGPPPKDPEERKVWQKVHRMAPGPNRQWLRSITYDGVADAIGAQYSDFLEMIS